jgi:ribosomal protein S25
MTLLATARQLNKARAEKPEKGYLTVEQWAIKEGVAASHMRNVLRELKKHGAVVMKEFRVWVDDRLRKTQHFKQVAKK